MKPTAVVVLLLLCVSAVLCQHWPARPDLYPFTSNGFDIIWLTDMSYVTEINYQNWAPNGNFSFYIFGGAAVRTVFVNQAGGGKPSTFYSDVTSNEQWFATFIDVHSFQYNSNTWFMGPVSGDYGHDPFGYNTNLVIISTQAVPNQKFSVISQPLGFEGTFYAATTFSNPLFPGGVLTYMVGYFPQPGNDNALQFGVVRTHLNLTIDLVNVSAPAFQFNYDTDTAVLIPNTHLATYSAYFKPFIFHMWNASWVPQTTFTFTYVVDPASYSIYQVCGVFNFSQPLTVNRTLGLWHTGSYGLIASAAIYYPGNLLLVGYSIPGMGNGTVVAYNLKDLSIAGTIVLPVNYSNPKALVVDQMNGNLYVGMNGGMSIVRINLQTLKMTGQQTVPFFLANIWSGLDAAEHVYFTTMEQHSKVFRVAKSDFCPNFCSSFMSYCSQGQCTCQAPMKMSDGECVLSEIINDRETIRTEHGGEVALGILFMFSFIAAAAGWFMWWRNRRHSYQSV